ncbi:HIG1 domain family member 2A, mitochondrial [Coccinella septempunctata]|uniref:HIG1 domain family member 2A, mitochondrial n=1 Tax=Coccinella septempunctata TaxID=41139 RepID=UPI001D085798|nr:HIG1 domain family member 2A, mitochondrial [Coccinella septempunctata]
MSKKQDEFDDSEFDWINIKKKYETVPVTQSEKLMKKLKENPFVPVGAILTTVCLSYGLYSYRTGKAKMSQLMMRSRVAAQGFTVFALVLGIGMGLHSK